MFSCLALRKKMEILRIHHWSRHQRFQAISHVPQVLHPRQDPEAHPSSDYHWRSAPRQISQSLLSKVNTECKYEIKANLSNCALFSFLHFKTEIPMNKIEVGNAPSPNLKKVQSKIGSLDNATHKPGEFLKSLKAGRRFSSPSFRRSRWRSRQDWVEEDGGESSFQDRDEEPIICPARRRYKGEGIQRLSPKTETLKMIDLSWMNFRETIARKFSCVTWVTHR